MSREERQLQSLPSPMVSEEQLPKYVGVQPYQVEPKQLRLAWKEIFHESMPDRLG